MKAETGTTRRPCAGCGREEYVGQDWRNWCQDCLTTAEIEDAIDDLACRAHLFSERGDGKCRCGYPLQTSDVSHYTEREAWPPVAAKDGEAHLIPQPAEGPAKPTKEEIDAATLAYFAEHGQQGNPGRPE